jgi:RimJ/RimL family protein N-acetyltransferase
MASVIPFEPNHADSVAALWRAVHPDWTWLDDPEMRAKMFEPSATFERIGYVVQRGSAVIATVFGSCALDPTWPRNRYINIEAQPEEIAADWLDPLLAGFVAADREHPGTWHVANPLEPLWPVMVPLLEAAGFMLHSSSMRMQWEGDSVAVPDPSPARFVRYAGGNPAIDEAIVGLHNRSYRSSRLMPPWSLENLWQPWPGLTLREYVLAMEQDRLVGYAEWFVMDGKPCINSFVAARSHWGTSVGAAVGTRAMQILVELGHRKIESSVVSTNAPSMKLHLKYGWRVAAEQARTYVRKL